MSVQRCLLVLVLSSVGATNADIVIDFEDYNEGAFVSQTTGWSGSTNWRIGVQGENKVLILDSPNADLGLLYTGEEFSSTGEGYTLLMTITAASGWPWSSNYSGWLCDANSSNPTAASHAHRFYPAESSMFATIGGNTLSGSFTISWNTPTYFRQFRQGDQVKVYQSIAPFSDLNSGTLILEGTVPSLSSGGNLLGLYGVGSVAFDNIEFHHGDYFGKTAIKVDFEDYNEGTFIPQTTTWSGSTNWTISTQNGNKVLLLEQPAGDIGLLYTGKEFSAEGEGYTILMKITAVGDYPWASNYSGWLCDANRTDPTVAGHAYRFYPSSGSNFSAIGGSSLAGNFSIVWNMPAYFRQYRQGNHVEIYQSNKPISDLNPGSLILEGTVPLLGSGGNFLGLYGIGTVAFDNIEFHDGDYIPHDDSVIITEGQDWQTITNLRTIQADSVLDFSFLADAPAGKYGKVVVVDGHFEFENRPGFRVKFFGPNLSWDLNFPSETEAQLLADYFVRMGYNIVRFIQFDSTLMPSGADLDETPGSYLDRLDYFFSCLKQRGIYAVIDLHSVREFSAVECPEYGSPFSKEIAVLNNIYSSARQAWERFPRALLAEHTNPYTNLTWAQDPALVGVCPVNEDFIYHTYENKYPEFDQPYIDWKVANNMIIQNPAQENAAYIQFQTEIQQETYEYYKTFLNSLGVQALMTGANNVEYKIQTLIRQRLDYTDNHCYWNHPEFVSGNLWTLPWKQPVEISDLSRSSGVHRIYGPCRIMDKPFMVSEFNYCYPNFYRAEGGALMGAYAAFQGWDGLFRFDFGHDANVLSGVDQPAYIFGAVYDPINRLTEKMIALLFLRRDVAESGVKIPYLVKKDVACNTYWPSGDYFPDNYRSLALCVGIGSLEATDSNCVNGKYTDVIVKAQDLTNYSGAQEYSDDSGLIDQLFANNKIDSQHYDVSLKQYISDTNQLTLDSDDQLFKAVTPRSEAFVFEDAGEQAGGCVTVENLSDKACTVLVSTVDDSQSISSSHRLLVLHLTDVQNDQVKFSPAMDIWREQGQLPHLVRRGSARISIQLDERKEVKVWAVDLSGARQKEMDITCVAQTITFIASTIQPEGKFLAYEVEVSDTVVEDFENYNDGTFVSQTTVWSGSTNWTISTQNGNKVLLLEQPAGDISLLYTGEEFSAASEGYTILLTMTALSGWPWSSNYSGWLCDANSSDPTAAGHTHRFNPAANSTFAAIDGDSLTGNFSIGWNIPTYFRQYRQGDHVRIFQSNAPISNLNPGSLILEGAVPSLSASGNSLGLYGVGTVTFDDIEFHDGDYILELLPGDANNDGIVNVGDLGILAANYGRNLQAENVPSSQWWELADFNSDGMVDLGDLGILVAHYE